MEKMWNAFGNGSGLHGGGGCVSKAQGWEFIPSSRLEMEGGGKRSQSAIRVLSSPASVGHSFEQSLPGPTASPSDGARGQIPWLELQSHHSRLKKRFEELKKRHGQERDGWMRQKEILLREVADIQGGENRRILLDLKTLLEEVQVDMKREESKRSELQLQYTKDRCAWELERAELKYRIAQLEAKGHNTEVGTVRNTETGDTLREQEEQRRLLADTHTAAMDLRCWLEHSERGWAREKSELLERFDSERKEWESQLRDMQRKIEELYNEVKAHRERNSAGPHTNTESNATRLSSCSASTVSSVLTEPSDAHSSSYSEPLTPHSHNSADYTHNCSEPADLYCQEQSGPSNQGSYRKYEHREIEAINTAELVGILPGCMGEGLGNKSTVSTGQEDPLSPSRGFQSMDIRWASDKKKNTMALNAALKEIARVSEELCSYQDEIRRRSDVKRSCTESTFFQEEVDMAKKDVSETSDRDFNLNEWCKNLQVLDKQEQVNWECIKKESTSPESDSKPPVKKRQAPPIPVRSTSWYLNRTSVTETEPSATESDRRCQSPCIHRKCSSPSIVRKFEAMLQENEGKILTDSGIVSCSVPPDSKCNISCCQSQWSCDGSRFGSSKSSTYVPVQKCLSDVNILASGAGYSQNQMDAVNKQNLKAQLDFMDSLHKGMATDSLTKSLDITSPYISTKVSQRNEMLERKTAEFNRMLFQAGMGVQCNKDSSSCVDMHCTFDNTTAIPSPCLEDNSRDALSDLMVQYPERKFTETAPQISPQLKSQTKESKFPPQQSDNKLKKVTADLQPPAVKYEDPNLKCLSVHTQDKELKPLCLEHRASSITHFDPRMQIEQMDLDICPPQLKTEKSSKAKSAGSDQHSADTKSKETERARQNTSNTKCRVLDESPWKPTTLAAYPRPVDSRSNYGAVERILKSYENLGQSQQDKQLQQSPGREEDFIELLDMLETQHQSRSSNTHTPQHQALGHKETHVKVKQSKESTVIIKKGFSRPACPAKRRLPSRWANHSSSTSSTSSHSPSPTTLATDSTPQQTFTYSTFDTETVIM
ncbi:protein SOGA3a isoform X1 [Electrophorus electricus]|uniref:protein SOGA3a isoform X1 n=2 Tax=Electrophorus electricus TaxID=8005 RepID=UPI0015CF9573|nr:protein SOGA3a isoform X1 [Electrophorus electricus]